MNLTTFQAFWLGVNTERKARSLPLVAFGEARDLWALAQEEADANTGLVSIREALTGVAF